MHYRFWGLLDSCLVAKDGGGRALSGTSAGFGADLSRFKDAKHFASRLGLCPGTKITGGKVLSGKTRRTDNRAAQALRLLHCVAAHRPWAPTTGGFAPA